ncbi:olfactory receptor 5V1-like [Mixophyes fleayi]|uniref:olfactory receptor 5V1-like n=1 Tax=Mixophyes fleayi TaxID=3061075 RepID=UPI003F4DF37E
MTGFQNNITKFTIQGFSNALHLQFPLFILFLLIYMITLLGNLTIFIVISINSHLHTPMYIFLLNLSFLDISFTSTILPNFLHVLFTQQKNISFIGCMTQMYLFVSLAMCEFLLLSAMAYDRYIAICHPLYYIVRMNQKNCACFAAAAWSIGFLDPIGHVVLISKLSFCASHVIDHFFCDVIPLLKLSCSDTFNVEIMIYIDGLLLTFNSFLLISASYVCIISTILNIQSSEGRSKAFSTCTSHLTCVLIFYGTIMCMYLRPTSILSPERDKFFSLLYIVLIPLLNPFIYTLRNIEFQTALRNQGLKYISYFQKD